MKPKTSKRGPGKMSKEARAARTAGIIADIKAGVLSYRRIADKHGVSLPTVNNKARAANLSRGRRKGARVVGRPVRPGRKAAKPILLTPVAAKVAAPKARRARRGRRVRRAAVQVPVTTGRSTFAEAFRALVLLHHPNMSISRFDKLCRLVEDASR